MQLFGARDRNELLGTSPWAWLKSNDTLRRALESRWRGEEFYQETTKTRDAKWARHRCAVLQPPGRRRSRACRSRLVGVIDLTKQVRAEEELQRLRADFAHAARISMLGELTASIAHEVNQPLAAIAAGGEASLRWLARPTPDVDEVRELTKRVVADARRASDIIARIRAMATRRAPEQTLLSLDDVIREALLFLRHEVQSRGVAVSHFPALGPQKVLADRTQLQQVIVNLAVNAMQAMAQAGSTNRNISIRTVAHDPATLRCSVEDSGPGIEPQHVARLFDSFFTTKDGGMGMGLRICRSVIEAHGGRIAADNVVARRRSIFFHAPGRWQVVNACGSRPSDTRGGGAHRMRLPNCNRRPHPIEKSAVARRTFDLQSPSLGNRFGLFLHGRHQRLCGWPQRMRVLSCDQQARR